MKTVSKKFVTFFKDRSLRKFIFLSIIIAMLILFVGMSLSRMIVYSKIKTNMMETNEKYAAVLFKHIDTEIKVVNTIMNNYINDATLNEIVRSDAGDYRFIELTIDASADISRTAAENLFVDDIVIVFDKKDIAFSKDGHFSKKYFLSANHYYEKIEKMTGQKNVIRTVPYFEKNYMQKKSGESYDVLLFSVPADGYTVNVMVDYKRMEEIFGQNIAEGKKIVILSETDLIYNNTDYSKELLSSVIGFREDNFDIKNNILSLGGEEFFDTYANMQNVGWTCHMLFPKKLLLNEINIVMTPFIYSYIFILIVMIFLVVAYRKRIIFPLKNLLSDLVQNFEQFNHQSEFEMIDRYITDMNFKNEKYTEFIENSTKRMQTIIFKEILENNTDIDEETQNMYFGNMEFEKFLLMKFCIVSCDGKAAFINEYIEDFLTREKCYFRIFIYSENSLFVMINCTDVEMMCEKVSSEAEKIRLMGNDVFVAVADAVDSIAKLSNSAQQIEQIIQNRNAGEEKALYTSGDIVSYNEVHIFNNAGKIIQKCILDKGSEETEGCLENYSKQKYTVGYSVYKKFLLDVISALEDISSENNIDIRPIGYDMLLLNNSECEFVNLQKEEAKLFALSGIVAERVSQIKKSEDDRIIDYIKENYSNYVSLDIVAQKFNMNPNYLSGYIKKKIGVNYQEFVNNLRLEHAKKLMTETDMTISEIADALGYDNSSSFIRFFKKHEKESPGAFRSRMKAGE